jgi:hypothetical protein
MLYGYPTKNGTGIVILGDSLDLESLYTTIHQLSLSFFAPNGNNERTKGQNQLLMNFAYEIRKAYSGNRLKEKSHSNCENKGIYYYGTKFVWTDILIFISVLRHAAGYILTDKLHQSNLYMLEHIVETSLNTYDPIGAKQIKFFIGQRINITNKYVFIIYQALHIRFITEKTGKQRFRNIPQLFLDYFSEYGVKYKELIDSFQKSAIEQGCEITELEFSEFPNIKW